MPDEVNYVESLSAVPLFRRYTQAQLKHVAAQAKMRSFAAGDEIVTQGEEGIGLFIVISGNAEAIRERLDGSKSVVNTFAPGGYFGEFALLDKGTRTATVVATEATECLVLLQWDFFAALRAEPDAAILALQSLTARFRSLLDTL